MRLFLVLLCITIGVTISTASVPPKVLEAQGSIVRVLNVDIPALGYGASYSSGTGYIIDSQKGYILTNHHVVDDNLSLLVYFNQWERPDTLPAYVIFSDEDRDLAVIRVKEDISDRKALRFADTLSLSMGDDVFVLGYPSTGLDNFELKYAKGVIGSHVSDSIIQLSATVNPGNSGGPALNANGEVIGTIYSKLQDRFENVGNILSNRLNYWTLDSADTYMTEEFYSDYFKERDSLGNVIGIRDTVDMLAYEYISMAHKFHAASERVDPDTTSRMEYLEQAIEAAEKAVEEDPENMVMRFHHLNMLFDAATLSCMGSSDENEKGSGNFAKRVNKAMEEIDKTIDELPRNERREWKEVQYLAEWRFEKVVNDGEVDCELWSRIVENIEMRRKLSRIRHLEFDRYLDYGYSPFFLDQSLRGRGFTDPFKVDGSRPGNDSGITRLFITPLVGFRTASFDNTGPFDDYNSIESFSLRYGFRVEYFGNAASISLEYSGNPFTVIGIDSEENTNRSTVNYDSNPELIMKASFSLIELGYNIFAISREYSFSNTAHLHSTFLSGLCFPRNFGGKEYPVYASIGGKFYDFRLDISNDETQMREGLELTAGYANFGYHLANIDSYVGLEAVYGENIFEITANFSYGLW